MTPLLVIYSWDTDYTSIISYSTYSSNILITSAVYNNETNLLVVVLNYSSIDLGEKKLQLNYNPPNYPQTYAMTTSSCSWIVKCDNLMAANYYSSKVYNLLPTLNIVA